MRGLDEKKEATQRKNNRRNYACQCRPFFSLFEKSMHTAAHPSRVIAAGDSTLS